MGCGRGARLGHVLRSWNVQKRLSHREPSGSKGPEPGAREALVRVTDEQGARCLSGTVRRRDLHLGLHPPPACALPSALPCPARGSEDPLSQQSCLAGTLPLSPGRARAWTLPIRARLAVSWT